MKLIVGIIIAIIIVAGIGISVALIDNTSNDVSDISVDTQTDTGNVISRSISDKVGVTVIP